MRAFGREGVGNGGAVTADRLAIDRHLDARGSVIRELVGLRHAGQRIGRPDRQMRVAVRPATALSSFERCRRRRQIDLQRRVPHLGSAHAGAGYRDDMNVVGPLGDISLFECPRAVASADFCQRPATSSRICRS